MDHQSFLSGYLQKQAIGLSPLSLGDRLQNAIFSDPAAGGAIGGGVLGTALGALLDSKQRWRGALTGGVVGAGLGGVAGAMMEDSDHQKVRSSIDKQIREAQLAPLPATVNSTAPAVAVPYAQPPVSVPASTPTPTVTHSGAGKAFGSTGVMVAAPIAAQIVATTRLRQGLQNAPNISELDIEKLRKASGINIPVQMEKGMAPNAHYLPPEQMSIGTRLSNPAANQHGGIFYHPEFAKGSVIGHELGHAQIYGEGGIPKLMQGKARTLGHIVGNLAAPAYSSYIVGSQRSDEEKASALKNSALVSFAGNVPMLSNEMRATSKGLDILTRSGIDPVHIRNSSGLLRKAYLTYLVQALIPAATQYGVAQTMYTH